jgi:two-component system sensor histidine kinase/response regulator
VILDKVRGAGVLLVEDNEVNQLVAEELLSSVAGVQVTIAGNGRDALLVLQERPFDAVLMDIQMPEMDGYEATARIRSEPRWQGLPIIAMTAHAMVQDRDRCLAAGMNGFVTKPFELRELCETLARWIAQPAAAPMPELPPVPGPESVALAGIDQARGLRNVSQRTALYDRLLGVFLASNAGLPTRLREARAQADAQTARRLAHTLKSEAATIGAMNLAHAAEQLEHSLETEEGVEEQLGHVERVLDDVIDGIRAHRGRHDGA